MHPDRQYKYASDHHKECTCTKCVDTLFEHTRRNGDALCPCDGCRATRSRLELIEQTKHRGRQVRARKEREPVAGISICDRPNCGSMAKSNVMGLTDINTGGVNGGERIPGQVCPACVDELVTWWEGPVGPRERAYSKAWVRPKVPDFPDMSSVQLMQLAIEKGREELNQETVQ